MPCAARIPVFNIQFFPRLRFLFGTFYFVIPNSAATVFKLSIRASKCGCVL